MRTRSSGFSTGGAYAVGVAAVAGFAVSVVNYFTPGSGIAGEPGTLLVIASTALLALFGWLLSRDRKHGAFFRIFMRVSSILNIIGTGFAGYLLHSWSLLAFMLVAALGWLAHAFWPGKTVVRPQALGR